MYFDYAATTPLRAAAAEAWLAATSVVGNSASIHRDGQNARRVLEDARETLAGLLGCEPIEVVFTSGGTEAINLAIKGLWFARSGDADAIVLPDGEHHATIDTVTWLAEHERAAVRPVPLSPDGRIVTDAFREALPGAAVATGLVANNEVGTVNDAAGLADASSERGVPLHLDAVAAFGHIEVDFARWRGDAIGSTGLSALSVSAHKIGGPVGIGAVVVSRHAQLVPLLHGGGGQRDLRAGTQDVAAAAAFAAAAREAETERESEAARLGQMRDRLVDSLHAADPRIRLLGDAQQRIPGNVHLLFPGARGETLLFLLDQRGFSVSTGSACQAGVVEPSHVVRAMGGSDDDARSVLRISLGPSTTAVEVEALARALPEVYAAGERAGDAP